MSSLLELAAVQVVTRNITVTEEDVGPRLLAYLDSGDPAVIILCFIFELCSFVCSMKSAENTNIFVIEIFSGMRCLCGKAVWSNVAVALVSLDLSKVATQFSAGGLYLDTVCIEAQLCSRKCLELFMKNPYAF